MFFYEGGCLLSLYSANFYLPHGTRACASLSWQISHRIKTVLYYFINKLYCTICYLIKIIKGRPEISNARYPHYLEPMSSALATQVQLALNRFHIRIQTCIWNLTKVNGLNGLELDCTLKHWLTCRFIIVNMKDMFDLLNMYTNRFE